MSNRDRKNGVPATATSIPLVDPHAMPENPSIGDPVRAMPPPRCRRWSARKSNSPGRDHPRRQEGLTGSVFFVPALVVLLYSTFFMFFFPAELPTPGCGAGRRS